MRFSSVLNIDMRPKGRWRVLALNHVDASHPWVGVRLWTLSLSEDSC